MAVRGYHLRGGTMTNATIPFYRLPITTATQIGRVRIVVDRNKQVYIAGSKVVSADPSADFLILTLANDQVYYVKARAYQEVLSGRSGR
jgi:hypothetical protein